MWEASRYCTENLEICQRLHGTELTIQRCVTGFTELYWKFRDMWQASPYYTEHSEICDSLHGTILKVQRYVTAFVVLYWKFRDMWEDSVLWSDGEAQQRPVIARFSGSHGQFWWSLGTCIYAFTPCRDLIFNMISRSLCISSLCPWQSIANQGLLNFQKSQFYMVKVFSLYSRSKLSALTDNLDIVFGHLWML
jgi:hypothetical protein